MKTKTKRNKWQTSFFSEELTRCFKTKREAVNHGLASGMMTFEVVKLNKGN